MLWVPGIKYGYVKLRNAQIGAGDSLSVRFSFTLATIKICVITHGRLITHTIITTTYDKKHANILCCISLKARNRQMVKE